MAVTWTDTVNEYAKELVYIIVGFMSVLGSLVSSCIGHIRGVILTLDLFAHGWSSLPSIYLRLEHPI